MSHARRILDFTQWLRIHVTEAHFNQSVWLQLPGMEEDRAEIASFSELPPNNYKPQLEYICQSNACVAGWFALYLDATGQRDDYVPNTREWHFFDDVMSEALGLYPDQHNTLVYPPWLMNKFVRLGRSTHPLRLAEAITILENIAEGREMLAGVRE